MLQILINNFTFKEKYNKIGLKNNYVMQMAINNTLINLTVKFVKFFIVNAISLIIEK